MKTLNDHTILYDDECPMCNLYTSGFVKSGMLDTKGREPYSLAAQANSYQLDRKRACNEIALIDKRTGTIYYGIDSLFKIIQNSFPVFKNLFAFAPFRWLIAKLYSFISYNRKVIIPGPPINSPIACTPSFNLKYRMLYLIVTWIFTALILHQYSLLLKPFVPESKFIREFVICGGQILFQSASIFLLDRKNHWTYLGNMMTISFAGALLLRMGMSFGAFTSSPIVFLIWFGVVALLMFTEHIRRMKLLSITFMMSLSWVLYRVIVLFITGIVKV
jgi:hypothetical protein